LCKFSAFNTHGRPLPRAVGRRLFGGCRQNLRRRACARPKAPPPIGVKLSENVVEKHYWLFAEAFFCQLELRQTQGYDSRFLLPFRGVRLGVGGVYEYFEVVAVDSPLGCAAQHVRLPLAAEHFEEVAGGFGVEIRLF